MIRLRHLYLKYLSLAVVLLLSSCATDDQLVAPPAVGNLRLSLSTSEQEASAQKAYHTTTEGEDALNENLIQTLDLYLYVFSNGTGEGVSKKHIHLGGINSNSHYDIIQQLTPDEMRALFPGGITVGSYCYVYAIANAPSNISTTENATIRNLKATHIEENKFKTQQIQDNFVMDGGNAALLSASNGTYTLSGTIVLRRAAAKCDLIVTFVNPDAEDEDGIHWTPDLNTMYVTYFYGVSKGNLNGDDLRDSEKYTPTDADYFHFGSIEFDKMRKLEATLVTDDDGNVVKDQNGNDSIHYRAAVPFYTYPNEWEDGSDKEPEYNLTVRWNGQIWNSGTNQYEDGHVDVHYQIPVRTYELKLNRNCYYQTNIKISVMGHMGETKTVELMDNTYIVLPWATSHLIPIDMREMKYLAVRDEEVVINNEASGYTEYSSSHPVTTEVTKVEYVDYSAIIIQRHVYEKSGSNYTHTIYNNATGAIISAPAQVSNPFGDYSPTASDGKLTLAHSLDLTKVYSRRFVTVSITNTTGLTEEVLFTINPPIYIIGETSSGNVFVNGKNYNTATQVGGGWGQTAQRVVYDDNNTSLGTITNPTGMNGSSTNTNPNHYIITTSALAKEYDYTLGDPRSSEHNELTYLNSLSEYYPTLETGTEDMLSPAFLIASSYGAVSSGYYMTKQNAIKRCASYQEDGYPAGRWRAPTAAEVIYIMSLSADGVIPSLFNLGSNDLEGYWCANGKISGDSSAHPYLSNDTQKTAIRCVYDIWYWGDEHATGTAAQRAIKGDNKTNSELEATNWVNAW